MGLRGQIDNLSFTSNEIQKIRDGISDLGLFLVDILPNLKRWYYSSNCVRLRWYSSKVLFLQHLEKYLRISFL